MDIKQRQIPSIEQQTILEALAEDISRPEAILLEVGSWCGDSAVILGRIARGCGGILFCVDWWKGSVTTELAEIAAKTDIFAVFWQRIRDEGLEDVVVPIRGRSDQVARILKPASCDLVFLDGDHRYSAVLSDIKNYRSLVRDGGILCGHDCEGRPEDYDNEFLERGKERDFFESVHCGTVQAVGELFADTTITHSIWSVRRSANDGWHRTTLSYPGIADFRQAAVPPIGCTRRFRVFRHSRSLYAIPNSMPTADVRLGDVRLHSAVVRADNLAEIEKALGEPVVALPVLIESHLGYNLVSFRDRITALATSIGPIDLTTASEAQLDELRRMGLCLEGDSTSEVKLAIEALRASSATGEQQPGPDREQHVERDLVEARRLLAEAIAQQGALRQRIDELEVTTAENQATTEVLERRLTDAARQSAEVLWERDEQIRVLGASVVSRDREIGALTRHLVDTAMDLELRQLGVLHTQNRSLELPIVADAVRAEQGK